MQAGSQLVDCKLLTEGLVVDQVVRRRGEVIKVSAEARDRLIREGHARPLPVVRMLVGGRIVGNRVTAIGDVVTMANPVQAKEWHGKRLADWLNASELGETLPARDVETSNSLRRMLVTRTFTRVTGWTRADLSPGAFLDVEQSEAMELIRKQLAEPVGWTPKRLRKRRRSSRYAPLATTSDWATGF